MPQQQDACTLLDEDHNKAARLFEQYKAAHDDNRKRLLASQLCQELLVHMQIEDEIFYPAFQRATHDDKPWTFYPRRDRWTELPADIRRRG